ncbi:MAG: replication initiation protein [Azonexus sp.]|jgi:plasmid replication initiation protein|uniref:replication initiation protein n=1 Tax=Azonexus sp. TaxID=1872668 RepID=UPI002827831F|nr:replication initiation protein [Azonexus sp.]MDR0777337.1 replication initiation protein [Azonexus sp.]
MKKNSSITKPDAIDVTRWDGGSVIMSNALSAGVHRLNLEGKQSLCLAMAQIDAGKATTDDRGALCVEFIAQEFHEYYPVSEHHVYERMKDGVDNILKAKVSFMDGNEKVHWPWVMEARYIDGEGRIAIEFNPKLTPHITREMSKMGGYTLYKLKAVSPLSFYPWKIYEILSQYRSTGWHEMELDDLHERLGTPPTYRKDFFKFKEKVLNNAAKELLEKSKVALTFEAIRTYGRRYKKIKFTFQDVFTAQEEAEKAIKQAQTQAIQPINNVAPPPAKNGKREAIAWL